MKFAKELEQDLVPEWRMKYLDYKEGKKKVKAVVRAIARANATPRVPAPPNLAPDSKYGSISPFRPKPKTPSNIFRFDIDDDESIDPLSKPSAPVGPASVQSSSQGPSALKRTPPMAINGRKTTPEDSSAHHGSFVPTPPNKTKSFPFQLPDPALAPEPHLHASGLGEVTPRPNLDSHIRPSPVMRTSSLAVPRSAYEVGHTSSPSRTSPLASLRHRIQQRETFRPLARRIFSVGAPLSQADRGRLDMDMVAVDQVRAREKEFFTWMDSELDKVETFYKSKEDEAGARLVVLREQLHEMRDRRIQEVAHLQHAKTIRKEEEHAIYDFEGPNRSAPSKTDSDNRHPNPLDPLTAWIDPLERMIGGAKAKALGQRPGRNSRALQAMQESPELQYNIQATRSRHVSDGRDYVRRPHFEHEVPYRTAKRKLKLALQEFYRGMELLKSYSLLNRTAFRKINKKYDKAVDAHPPLRYMSEKVNKAWFVQSDILDGHINAVEDLYARYFERGNRKIATGKLRGPTNRNADQSASAFRNGLLIGTGAVFVIQGVIYGADLLKDPDPTIRIQTSYLLQIYAGYFLALYLFSWFCLDCSVWTRNKINYGFVFEFDPRHSLDWRELAEFPSFLVLVFGLFVWLNFSRYGSPEMYLYYPVILISFTTLIIFFPAPIIFPKSRSWFVYSHWRLLLAGLYPVEFRDFFLGDMYCSLTYFMSNIELFFCLYANSWDNPSQCNSSHSRLLGFLSTLPGIWRALQCLRRYYDTRNIFPHLVNCGKYSMTIIYYVTLSMYRIQRGNRMLAVFTTFATVNAIYCSLWDLFMDWSLLQPNAKKRFLRDVRGYKSTWWYYAAMTLDPILRFNWIFYSIYTTDLQHSTIVSFLVAFSEVTRRGIWTLFRVENEHCSNVVHFKASRDVPLPYTVEDCSQESLHREDDANPTAESTQTSPEISRRHTQTLTGAESQGSAGSSLRHRAPTRTLTRIVAEAHMQDFEKKRKPSSGADDREDARRALDRHHSHRAGSSDEDDYEEDEHEVQDEQDVEDVLHAEALRDLGQARDR